MDSPSLLVDQVRDEILRARGRVYQFGSPTPMERLELSGPAPEVWVKREDISPIKCYKWRGSGNLMASLDAVATQRGVVTASAGNHAQGVALAAARLGIRARIYMPRSTPKVKVDAVSRLGGDWIEVRQAGDSYDEAMRAAMADQMESGATYVHAYDDLKVIAGQGTLADEVVLSGAGKFDAVFLQIGGGGIAAGVSAWLKFYWPEIVAMGVEGEDQASMSAAFRAGHPVRLDELDLFCDGTAVRQAGQLPYEICRQTLDEIVTVSNDEVRDAMRVLWEQLRCISEPSGAVGLAALLRERKKWVGKRVLVVLCGANIDFRQIGHVARLAGAQNEARLTLRIRITEEPGSMLRLLDRCFAGVNIADFQYGTTSAGDAWPIITLTAENEAILRELACTLNEAGYDWRDLSGAEDVKFRAIALHSELLNNPLFLRLDFYERAGALHDFLSSRIRGNATICYFNYIQSGERIGRALIGLDFTTAEQRDAFVTSLPTAGDGYRSCTALDTVTTSRILGSDLI